MRYDKGLTGKEPGNDNIVGQANSMDRGRAGTIVGNGSIIREVRRPSRGGPALARCPWVLS